MLIRASIISLCFVGISTLAAAAPIAIAPDIDDPTIEEIVEGAVNFTVLDEVTMSGSFTPNFGLSLDEAAAIGGYDHFNWVQVVTEWPGPFCVIPPVGTPTFDPAIGGCFPEFADLAPYYWDEGDIAPDERYLLKNNIVGDFLQFVDIPNNVFVTPGEDFMEFHTYLVGVRGLFDFDVLTDPLVWQSDNRTDDDGDGGIIVPVVSRNIDPIPGLVGSIFSAEYVPLGSIDAAQRDLLIGAGAANLTPVPLPASVFLLLSALFFSGRIFRQRS